MAVAAATDGGVKCATGRNGSEPNSAVTNSPPAMTLPYFVSGSGASTNRSLAAPPTPAVTPPATRNASAAYHSRKATATPRVRVITSA